MCDRPWTEVADEAKAADQKVSVAEILSHADELARIFEEHEPGPGKVRELTADERAAVREIFIPLAELAELARIQAG